MVSRNWLRWAVHVCYSCVTLICLEAMLGCDVQLKTYCTSQLPAIIDAHSEARVSSQVACLRRLNASHDTSVLCSTGALKSATSC